MGLPKLMQPPKEFRFEEPAGRPFRICSIETELDGAGQILGEDLYKNGIIFSPGVQAYSWHPESANHPFPAYLKFDGSVTAGELIFDRLDLTNPAHAAALLRAHERLRILEKNGDIQYNPNCGGHIHMDAAGFGFWDLVRLLTLFGFCEEPIFRLAGAGKTYGHRTLYKGYDQANGGAGYSDPVSKGPFNTALAAWNTIRSQKRMSGINTTIYLAQKDVNGYSHGGSICTGKCPTARLFLDGTDKRYPVFDKKTCSCPKKKNTIEWRVWNAQGNPRILYAWIALMQAMHAWSWRPADAKQYSKHDPMPAFTWTWRPFSKLTEDERRLAQDRVQFMFHELPLTSEEKDALRYAFMRTPYKIFGKDWMKAQANTPYKAPEFPNEYKKSYKRKLGNNPLGKRWADDSRIVYDMDEPALPRFTAHDPAAINRVFLRDNAPPPGDGDGGDNRIIAINYHPIDLYNIYLAQGGATGTPDTNNMNWELRNGIRMTDPLGNNWVYEETTNQWRDPRLVAPRRTNNTAN